MAAMDTQVNLADKIIMDYIKSHMDMGGESSFGYIGPTFGGLMSMNGYVAPENKAAVFEAIKTQDPQWFNTSIKEYVDGHRNLTGSGANDTLTFLGAPDEGFGEDWLAPLGLIAGAGMAHFGGLGGLMEKAGISNPFSGAGAGVTDAAWGVNPQLSGSQMLEQYAANNPGVSNMGFGGDVGVNAVSGASSVPSWFGDLATAGLGVGALGAGASALTASQKLAAAADGGNMGFNGDVGENPVTNDFNVPSSFGDIPGGNWLSEMLGVSPEVAKALGIGAGALAGSMNGSKPAGVTTTVQDIPDWLKPYATSVLDQGQGIVNANKITPETFSQSDNVLNGIMGGSSIQAPTFNPYGGMTTPQTYNDYIGKTSAGANNDYIGRTASQASNDYIGRTVSPLVPNSYLGKTVGPTSNSYIGATATPGTNAHLGMDNPYFEAVLQKSLGDTQGRVNAQFGNRSAFGGSANQELLQRGLSDQSNALRYGEYDKQTQLSEADIARKLASQQADLARNSSLLQGQNQFNATLAANDLTRNSGLEQRTGEFNAGLSQADLARNSQLMQNQGQFNASLGQADLARNSQLSQNQGQFNASLGQNDLARNAQLMQNQGQFNASLYQNDATRNANIWGTDANRNQNAYQYGQTQAYNAATNAPAYSASKTAARFAPLTAQTGLLSFGGSQTSTPYFSNPAGGALYGGLLGSQLFGGK